MNRLPRSHCSSTGTLKKPDFPDVLPLDLLPHVLTFMDIRTVQAFKTAISNRGLQRYHGIMHYFDKKVSVVDYLDKNFGNGVRLLEAMSKSYAFLSGSTIARVTLCREVSQKILIGTFTFPMIRSIPEHS
ncbi:hypothetical protein K470DRAFT_253935 [Piedraia hortae CBS 480.64]|uniref:F-box domain-containing protein n=1 Tax=Piedraia hortae CBS 480.64 TaxID=1314780 RepID=A0A6A7CA09_9PEZI|nr:hypothetical protein K470DRAFT_253935 [Piedraia hortae CBS 480.64]